MMKENNGEKKSNPPEYHSASTVFRHLRNRKNAAYLNKKSTFIDIAVIQNEQEKINKADELIQKLVKDYLEESSIDKKDFLIIPVAVALTVFASYPNFKFGGTFSKEALLAWGIKPEDAEIAKEICQDAAEIINIIVNTRSVSMVKDTAEALLERKNPKRTLAILTCLSAIAAIPNIQFAFDTLGGGNPFWNLGVILTSYAVGFSLAFRGLRNGVGNDEERAEVAKNIRRDILHACHACIRDKEIKSYITDEALEAMAGGEVALKRFPWLQKGIDMAYAAVVDVYSYSYLQASSETMKRMFSTINDHIFKFSFLNRIQQGIKYFEDAMEKGVSLSAGISKAYMLNNSKSKVVSNFFNSTVNKSCLPENHSDCSVVKNGLIHLLLLLATGPSTTGAMGLTYVHLIQNYSVALGIGGAAALPINQDDTRDRLRRIVGITQMLYQIGFDPKTHFDRCMGKNPDWMFIGFMGVIMNMTPDEIIKKFGLDTVQNIPKKADTSENNSHWNELEDTKMLKKKSSHEELGMEEENKDLQENYASDYQAQEQDYAPDYKAQEQNRLRPASVYKKSEEHWINDRSGTWIKTATYESNEKRWELDHILTQLRYISNQNLQTAFNQAKEALIEERKEQVDEKKNMIGSFFRGIKPGWERTGWFCPWGNNRQEGYEPIADGNNLKALQV